MLLYRPGLIFLLVKQTGYEGLEGYWGLLGLIGWYVDGLVQNSSSFLSRITEIVVRKGTQI